MQKLFRRATAGALIFAAVLCVAAGYASRQPFSFVGRCTGLTYTVGVECNPLYRLGRALGGLGSAPPQATEGDNACCDDGSLCIPEEPQAVSPLADLLADVHADDSLSLPCPRKEGGSCPGCCTSLPDKPGGQEEQEDGTNDDTAKSLLNSRTIPDWPKLPNLHEFTLTRPTVDTMEFRPSDAKKGEFDRIPF